MQFSTILVAAVACATGAVANLHTAAWCISSGLKDSDPKNVAATEAACGAYKERHTGNDVWDTCPDCYLGVKDDDAEVATCNSPAKHIGGDEWEEYCIQYGAVNGAAN
ncbi:hypothetical protein GCG54_00006280 [Colletotrichum gloeosporioides]|uniref:Uncharacterized protein n=3 Tax=Colletotrichum gloeosporioides species complex TaxID=2707338 RepID=T0JYI7_COLGC|nr:uncharacterized protein GCG54_00006280 [Colletotrichum gloeosporioides]XP_053041005.1 uncharacterized protein COL26b_002132 [Colletotrichum chrysophilum]EQB44549.1 hypothetical protein CGLO_16697 [Colletotrichum gloeosporioides Cg-14]KAF4875756.1 hypothetical protein CGCSCA1_v005141 [Colletotrichum siamense]KAI8199007.1 hypothetical protein KHU50_008245 [Colletotrichum sp. SAR 10_65]KAF3805337.1 hypothetical protein GCG54_00006280 [Colletotrichum gloeosporioides]KAJ0348893.1 hypothetical p